MLIDIDRITVNDRIRKDFGDIEALADDIRSNGLINPPVVNKEYVLLAGERRLRACKLLGWPQIEVRMMDTRDAEHELNIEISENDERKGFTKSERVDYMRRLLRIEQARAKERMSDGGKGVESSTPLRADEATAQQFGIGKDTMRREMFIADNADMLDPADFADWDEGRLSTNKAFQRIKAALARVETERDDARHVAETLKRQRDEARDDADGYADEIRSMQEEIDALEKQSDRAYEDGYKAAQKHQGQQPQVVERVVESDAARKRISELEHEVRVVNETDQRLRKKLEETRKQLQQANDLLGESDRTSNARRDIEQLTIATNSYLRNYGGRAWAFDQFDRVDESTQQEFEKAITSLAAFAQNLAQMIQDKKQLGATND